MSIISWVGIHHIASASCWREGINIIHGGLKASGIHDRSIHI